jgi:hypothetical protein
MNRFKLPQVCHCGARGSITFEPTPLSLGSERDPDPAIITAEGLFRLDDGGGIVCRDCGDRLG